LWKMCWKYPYWNWDTCYLAGLRGNPDYHADFFWTQWSFGLKK
jgi:hypothetical protein